VPPVERIHQQAPSQGESRTADVDGAARLRRPTSWAADLQQAAGNKALSGLLTAQADTVTLQRQQAPTGTSTDSGSGMYRAQVPFLVVGGDSRRRSEARQRELNTAVETLRGSLQVFGSTWMTTATLAVATAPEPTDPALAENYNRALAGNLLWAATSLAARWHPIVVPMSFVGAAVGTGAAATPTAPSGRDAVASALAAARDRLVADRDDDLVLPLALDCATENVTDPEAQRRKLWQRLFPATAYNNSAQLLAQVRMRLGRALADWRRQYDAWQIATREAGAALGRAEHQRLTGNAGALLAGAGRYSPAALGTSIGGMLEAERMGVERYRREHPFQPTLRF